MHVNRSAAYFEGRPRATPFNAGSPHVAGKNTFTPAVEKGILNVSSRRKRLSGIDEQELRQVEATDWVVGEDTEEEPALH